MKAFLRIYYEKSQRIRHLVLPFWLLFFYSNMFKVDLNKIQTSTLQTYFLP